MELRKRQVQLKKELELQENKVLFMDFSSDTHLKEKEDQILLLHEAVGKLGEDQRLCIELFYLNSKSYQEIMQVTDFSANEVKSKIQNGKRNLKLFMEQNKNEQED